MNRWTSPSASSFPGLVPGYVKTPADIPALAVEFERLGFDDVMDGEHILYAAQMNHPGGAGNFEHSRVEQHSDRWDTLVMFAAIAARTTRLRLVSGIILAAAHTYAVLARQAATLDSISGGRFTLGVGGGWNAAEFAQLGIDRRRARRPLGRDDPRLPRALVTGTGLVRGPLDQLHRRHLRARPGHRGRRSGLVGRRRPVRAGRAPGSDPGRGLAVARGGRLRRDRPVDRVDQAACERHGRDPATIGVRASLTATADWNAAMSPDDLTERAVTRARRLAALGVTHFNVPLSYYGIGLDALGDLLKALRAA